MALTANPQITFRIHTPMSLRNQIIYRILFSSICILVLGGAIAIWQARQAVTKEVDASVHLALQ
jgi:two-component system sensor histidine kinase UhpB